LDKREIKLGAAQLIVTADLGIAAHLR
jgi:hypothetical protein